MAKLDFVVFIVDDDVRMCEALAELCSSRGVASVAFGSVDQHRDRVGCRTETA